MAKDAKTLDRYLRWFFFVFHLPVASYIAQETHAFLASLAYVVYHPFLPVESEYRQIPMQLS